MTSTSVLSVKSSSRAASRRWKACHLQRLKLPSPSSLSSRGEHSHRNFLPLLLAVWKSRRGSGKMHNLVWALHSGQMRVMLRKTTLYKLFNQLHVQRFVYMHDSHPPLAKYSYVSWCFHSTCCSAHLNPSTIFSNLTSPIWDSVPHSPTFSYCKQQKACERA